MVYSNNVHFTLILQEKTVLKIKKKMKTKIEITELYGRLGVSDMFP